MPTEVNNEATSSPALLAADEPTPFTVLNTASSVPVLLVCDHASRRFPKSLGDLGLDPVARRGHLALDIGAGALTRRLAASLAVTAVLARYSRLIVDCNRDLLDSGAFLEFSDGVVIPGNRNLDLAQRTARAEEFYWPYHRAIDRQLKRLREPGKLPAVIAIHSFTPVMNGISRPWEFGVLWDSDPRISKVLIRGLRNAGFVVGDNEPYSGKAPQDFTIDRHAEAAGLPHVGIEVRQDLIDDEDGVNRIAGILHGIIAAIPSAVFSAANDTAKDSELEVSTRRQKKQRG